MQLGNECELSVIRQSEKLLGHTLHVRFELSSTDLAITVKVEFPENHSLCIHFDAFPSLFYRCVLP